MSHAPLDPQRLERKAPRARALALLLLWLCVGGLLGAAGAAAQVLVLKDGRALRHVGEERVEGELVIVLLETGTLVSLRESSVDWAATGRARELLSRGAGADPGAGPKDRRRPGPRELDSLPQRELYEALLHTGRSAPQGDDVERADQAATAEPGRSRRKVVDLLLEPFAAPQGDVARRSTRASDFVPVLPPPSATSAPGGLAEGVAGDAGPPSPARGTEVEPAIATLEPAEPTPAEPAPDVPAAREAEPAEPPRVAIEVLAGPSGMGGLPAAPEIELAEPPKVVAEVPAGPSGTRGPEPLLPDPAGGSTSPYTGPLDESIAETRGRLAPLVAPPVSEVKPDAMLALLGARELERASRAPRETGPRFAAPRDGEAVFGDVLLEARPASPTSELESIAYRIDGVALAESREPPFQVSWRVPRERAQHILEAEIRRRDGKVERARARVHAVVPDARVEVELVPLAVSVTNQQYLFVRELEAEDFLVYEDGVRQEIAHFSRDPVPLSILVLVDLSFSMHGRKLEMAIEGIRRLIERLGPDDRIGIATFGEKLELAQPLTSDRERAAAALGALSADGGTSMFDSEMSALGLLEPEAGRRVLVVLGDGEDYLSRTRIEGVIEAAQRANVSLFAVGMITYRLRDGMPENWAEKLVGKGRPKYWTDRMRVRGLEFLHEQSVQTGGVLYLPKFAGELPYVFDHLLAELRSSYSLGYYPTNPKRDGAFRTISVYVDGAGLEARARRGYYAPRDEPSSRTAENR